MLSLNPYYLLNNTKMILSIEMNKLFNIKTKKIKIFWDLIDENKSLILYDAYGSFIISNKGYKLTRKYKQNYFLEIQSYYFITTRKSCTYILSDGDKLNISYNKDKKCFLLTCSDQIYECYKFEWI